MISIKLVKDNLHIKTETFLGGSAYANFMTCMQTTPGAYFLESKYTWVMHKSFIDSVVFAVGMENIAWFTSIEQIKGISLDIPQDYVVETKSLEDMKIKPYPFQAIGISFLHDKMRALVCDEMGLGKTATCLGAFHRLYKEGLARKMLVVCPASLKFQWANEVRAFTSFTPIVVNGTPKKRKMQLSEFANSDNYEIAIINYELVRNDLELIKSIPVDVIGFDEFHKCKNKDSQTTKAVKQLKSTYAFGLTGTPMQNKPDELYSLFDIIKPGYFGNYWSFRSRYMVMGEKFGKRNVLIGYRNLGDLRQKTAPYMIRRMKVDVAPDLPELIYTTVPVEMSKDQEILSDSIKEDFSALLQEIQDSSSNLGSEINEFGEEVQKEHPKQGQVLGYLNMLIGASDSPELFKMSESKMVRNYIPLLKDKVKSPKIDELERICEEQIENGNTKIVVFTQFVRMQQLIVKRLEKNFSVLYANGATPTEERQRLIDKFREDENVEVFVVTDALNYGVNLQFSNVLVNVDLPWNPSIVDQRNGRVHRIGSKHNKVTIIDLVTVGSIDEKIKETILEKKNLSDQLVEKNSSEKSVMQSLLKQVAGM